MDLSATGLPLLPFLPGISAELEAHRLLVLTAEPGAGKSTLVPPFLMEAPWLAGKKIIMLEPRRLAAAAVASRIADLLGEPLGKRAGYRVRSSSRVSRETRVEVVTEALLTRAIQNDPLLGGVGLVIFDEFHERSIHADLAMALTLEVRRARPDLALLVMSATIDGGRVSAFLGGAPALSCPGRLHPVETRHIPVQDRQRWEDAVSAALPRVVEETEGDVLVFLPGVPEIRRVSTRISAALAGRIEIQGLHGSLPLEEQRRVLAGGTENVGPHGGQGGAGARRRVVLATSIAETSLTVPGVRVVADAGWARLTRFHPATGLDRLVTERVSVSAAEQRRGRAGRLGPGVCYRFWRETEGLLAHPEPEILRSDLAGLVLECALWGARSPEGLAWLDPPPAAAWGQAGEVLAMLGLTGEAGPTALGRQVAGLGLSPRLGVLALEGARRGAPALAAACAALLQDRDGSAISGDPDLRLRLEMVRTGRGGGDGWRAGAEREARRILGRMGLRDDARWSAEEERSVGGLLAHAFPDRIARRERDGGYRFVTGRAAAFPGRPSAPTALASRAAEEWVVAPETDAGETAGTIRLAAPLTEGEAEEALLPVTVEEVEIRWTRLVPRAHRFTRAGRLTLTERPAPLPPQAVAASLEERLAREGIGILPWNEKSRRLLERVRFWGAHGKGASGVDLSDAGLAARAAEWLAPHLALGGGPVLTPEKLSAALRGLLGADRGRLDAEVPESLVLPTGGRRGMDYSGGAPAVEARIQEVFGLAASPLVCGVPVVFRLLSPAGRPLQVTTDLSGFWKGSYAEVRKEMRGRYPRHYWPEDPLQAEPTTRAKPRKG
jgi:ATP-dependent helicase HrpB